MKRAVLLVFLAGCHATPPVLEVGAGGLQQPTPVTALAFSPDGTLLLSGDPEGVVRVWDVEAGKLLRTFDALDVPIVRIVVSPDGSRLAALSDRDRVTLFPLREGLAARTIDAGHLIRTAAFLPDGSALVTAGEGRRVECWDLATGEARWMVDEGSFPVQQVMVSPDGATVACRVRGGKVTLRAAGDGVSILPLPGIVSAGVAAGYLPDSRFAVLSTEPAVWDPPTGARGALAPWVVRLQEWPGLKSMLPELRHERTGERILLVESMDPTGSRGAPLVISRDGRRVARGDAEGRLQIFDTRNPDAAISPFAGVTTRLAVSPGGRYIAAWGPSARGVRVWPSDRPGCIELVGRGKDDRFSFMSEDSIRVLSPGFRETLKLRSFDGTFSAAVQDSINLPTGLAVSMSRSGKAIASYAEGVVIVRRDEMVVHQSRVPPEIPFDELIPSEDGSVVTAVSLRRSTLLRLTSKGSLQVDVVPAARSLEWVDVSPDGSHILFPDDAGRLIQFDMELKVPVRRLASDHGRVTAARFFQDGIGIAAGTDRGRLLVFRAEGPPALLSARHTGRITALALSSDNLHLASAGDDGTVLLHYLGPR